jgi:hypothetical protein
MTARRSTRAAHALGCLAFVLAGCGGGGDGDGNRPAPLNIAASDLFDGVIGLHYEAVVAATGGTGAKSFVLSGSLPPGLSLAADGTISGVPEGPAGSAEFTVTVTDSGSPAETDSEDFTLTIAEPLVADAGDPPLAQVGVAYSHTVAVSGGIPPYTFELVLPSGLSIDASGVISGTPADDARTEVTFAEIRDSATPRQFDAVELRVAVELEVATTALPDAIGGVLYEAQLEARGGLPDFGWEVTGGTLPFPLNVESDGAIHGQPDASCTAENATLDVSVTDFDTPRQSASRSGITLAINPRDVSLPVSSAPPVGPIGEPYSHAIIVAPGVPPYAFAVTAGALPAGIALNAGSGELSGVPTVPGTSNFTIEVTDDCGTTASRAFTLIMRDAPTGRNDTIGTATPIGNGTIFASISPSGHPNSVFEPDEDYYVVQTTATSTITVDLTAGFGSSIDTVIELVDAGGNRLQTCSSPQFSQECMNDDREPGNLDSLLVVRVAGATTFYIHVVEWRGDGRPDLQYGLDLSGIN